ncbi:uncharacterized protein AMSG_08762 [Thecamonas trahens ATCC 50062]|uniref:Uncharacterized protein n=1 Tax=Thecamonas trahens ATCC 50062 TaxID=461836 RepID=A0A0L0DML8_THETB|nr:hypothetical protein AMSG_08762 [Thecamonas trahens ATCC 50062]KNC53271.1 hypothetical protein AMSG_08762 [Thecamonas trahens ATCC 50062]|eukprot:XP_013754535.1 hypothetical protein AMSG_08762 [Thecamonas trahens ATCC 50062]
MHLGGGTALSLHGSFLPGPPLAATTGSAGVAAHPSGLVAVAGGRVLSLNQPLPLPPLSAPAPLEGVHAVAAVSLRTPDPLGGPLAWSHALLAAPLAASPSIAVVGIDDVLAAAATAPLSSSSATAHTVGIRDSTSLPGAQPRSVLGGTDGRGSGASTSSRRRSRRGGNSKQGNDGSTLPAVAPRLWLEPSGGSEMGLSPFRAVAAAPAPQGTDPLFAALHGGTVLVWAVGDGRGALQAGITVSKAPNLCVDWSPLSRDVLAVAGVSGSIKLVDLRASEGLSWRAATAHGGKSVTSLAWSPLVPSWLASAGDDGAVRVWDVRRSTRPVLDLAAASLPGPPTCLAWSPSHADHLGVGTLDGSVAVLSLARPPHFTIADASLGPLSAFPVCALAAACTLPEAYHAVTLSGELISFALDEMTLAALAEPGAEVGLARYAGSGSASDIATAVYGRKFDEGFRAIADGAARLQARHRTSDAGALLDLCVPRTAPGVFDEGNEGALDDDEARAAFGSDLVSFTFNVPPNFPSRMASLPSRGTREALARLNLSLRLHSWVAAEDVAALLGALDTIVNATSEALAGKTALRIPVATLVDIVDVLAAAGKHVASLDFGLRLAAEFETHGRWPEFVPLAEALLTPTIYDAELAPLGGADVAGEETPAAASSSSTTTSTLRLPTTTQTLRKPRSVVPEAQVAGAVSPRSFRAADDTEVAKHTVALSGALESAKFVVSQLKLERSLRLALDTPNWADAVVDLVDSSGVQAHTLLSIRVLEAYLQALMIRQQSGMAFVFASRIAHKLADFVSGLALWAYVDNHIVPGLERAVELAVELAGESKDPDAVVDVVIDVVYIVYQLEEATDNAARIAGWIDKLSESLENALEALCMQSSEAEEEAVLIAKDLIEDRSGERPRQHA